MLQRKFPSDCILRYRAYRALDSLPPTSPEARLGDTAAEGDAGEKIKETNPTPKPVQLDTLIKDVWGNILDKLPMPAIFGLLKVGKFAEDSGINEYASRALKAYSLLKKGWQLDRDEILSKTLIRVTNRGPLTEEFIQALNFIQPNIVSVRNMSTESNSVSSLLNAIASGSLRSLQNLDLSNNKIGDAGMIEFSSAIASGSLPNLTKLWLTGNKIGDDGMQAFASAVASGSLPSLTHLELGVNNIGDVGMAALADAISSGSLGSLKELHLWKNRIGDQGIRALASAIASGSLGKLTRLSLIGNEIGDAGMRALADSIASGSAPALQYVYVSNNPGRRAPISAALRDLHRQPLAV